MAYISKDVSLSMVDYAASPVFTDADVLHNMQNFGDPLGSVNVLDCTTLENGSHTYINGLNDNGGSIEFTFLWDKTVFAQIHSAVGIHKSFQLKFPDGTIFTWGGYITPNLVSKGVDEVLQFTATVSADTDVTVSGI